MREQVRVWEQQTSRWQSPPVAVSAGHSFLALPDRVRPREADMVAQTGRKKASRSTSSAGVSEKLRALQANRERVDAEVAARRTREDELMRRYAVAADQSD